MLRVLLRALSACTPLGVVQGVMLDIVSMLFTLLRAYVPAEFRWSFLMDLYDMFAWNITMCTILYCVFFALACAHCPHNACPGQPRGGWLGVHAGVVGNLAVLHEGPVYCRLPTC